jgi:hypothetical protein
MNKLSLFQEDGGTGVSIDLNDRVECVLLNEFIPSTPTDESGTVTDQCQVQLRGVSGRLTAAEINRMLQFAREKPAGGQAVFLNFAVHENEVVYRTRVVDGTISIEQGYSKGYKTGRLVITVAFEHLPFWEGPEETIPLSNLNGTNVSNGLRVYGCNDLVGVSPNRRCSYADIAANLIKGELPTPIKLVVQNNGNTSYLGWVTVGENFTNPSNAKWQFEGESGTGGSGTIFNDIDCSAGAYLKGTLAAGVTPPSSYFVVGNWPLSAADLSAYAGQRIRFLLVPMGVYAAADAQNLYQISIGTYKSEWVKASSDTAISYFELFDFRLPNFLEGVPSLGPSSIQLRVRNTKTYQSYWSVDYFVLLPSDGWISVGTYLADNEVLVIDGPNNRLYQASADDTNKAGIYYSTGNSLILKPGKAHRLYFLLYGEGVYSTDIDLRGLAWASYRPRRASL